MEADWESQRHCAAWQADNSIPIKSLDEQGQGGPDGQRRHLQNVELAGTTGYSEQSCWRNWARLDLRGTQQIQQLVVLRRLLGLSSTSSSNSLGEPDDQSPEFE